MLLAGVLIAQAPLFFPSYFARSSAFFQPGKLTCVCALAAPAILTREQRRVLFADGLLANGDAAESSKPPAANLGLSQSAATHSSKSSTSEYSEVRLACERPDHLQSPPNACVSVKLPLRKRRGSPDRVCFLTLMQSDGAL